MICREIKTDPDGTLKNFDYFNDYDDTRRYAVNNCPLEVVKRLDDGFKEFLKKFWNIKE